MRVKWRKQADGRWWVGWGGKSAQVLDDPGTKQFYLEWILHSVMKSEEKTMSPCELEVLLHCYVSPEVHPRITAPAVQDAIARFLDDGIVELCVGNDRVFAATGKGKAWLDMILATPYPEQKWIDPREPR